MARIEAIKALGSINLKNSEKGINAIVDTLVFDQDR